MKRLEIILRIECVEHVLRALREAGAPRMTVSHVHALGSGVDPEHYCLSFEEGGAYTEKAQIMLVCRDKDAARCLEAARAHALTGHRGDGVIFVSNVERAVKIRTGVEDALALV